MISINFNYLLHPGAEGHEGALKEALLHGVLLLSDKGFDQTQTSVSN